LPQGKQCTDVTGGTASHEAVAHCGGFSLSVNNLRLARGEKMTVEQQQQEQIAEAFDAGRRTGFGVSALALSLVAFLSMLGAEKAVLAIVLGALAMRGTKRGAVARRLGIAAIGMAAVFLATLAVVLVVFWDQLVELIRILERLS
jgi:hypothetical protein